MNKLNIAIYGDSFADPTWVKTFYKGWPELLSEHYDISNYALSGSGCWWSYDKFLETHQAHDLSIFVVTVPGRIHIEYNDKHLNLNPVTWPVWDGINMGEMYFRYFYSKKREDCFHNFMVRDLISRENVLVVPAFKESIDGHNGWSLCHFSDTETAFYGLKHSGTNEKRKCHLTKENNEMVYLKVLEAIQNKDKILSLAESDFCQPEGPLEKYWY